MHPELWKAQGKSTELFIITEEEFETNLSKKHKIILDGTACSVRPCWVRYPRSVNQRTCTYTHALMVSLLTSIYRAQRKWNWKKERRGNIFFSFFFRQKANFPLSQPVLIPPHVWCTNVIIDAYTKEGPPSRTDSLNRGESFPNQSFLYGRQCSVEESLSLCQFCCIYPDVTVLFSQISENEMTSKQKYHCSEES